MFPWSVIPMAGWPSATAAAITSLTRAAPSSMEKSVWRCRCVMESPSPLAPPTETSSQACPQGLWTELHGCSSPYPATFMAFKGWQAEALEFFEGLEADNSKAYWQDHKADYEKLVKAPMEELLAALNKEFGEGRIFRPYRDVRFSKDKAPYKTNIAATLSKGGYVSLSSEGLGAGSGYYGLMPDQLDRFRRAVDDDRTGKPLARLVDRATVEGIEVSAHDVLKTA